SYDLGNPARYLFRTGPVGSRILVREMSHMIELGAADRAHLTHALAPYRLLANSTDLHVLAGEGHFLVARRGGHSLLHSLDHGVEPLNGLSAVLETGIIEGDAQLILRALVQLQRLRRFTAHDALHVDHFIALLDLIGVGLRPLVAA